MCNFKNAYDVYKYLRERGFSEKSSLKLVGDRYRLTRTGRNALFRGVVEEPVSEARKKKLVAAGDVKGRPLGLDWYNVLITVESRLRGALLFIADDGMLRDSSAVHGSFRAGAATEAAITDILTVVRDLKPLRVDAFLDSPIAFSALMAEKLRARLASEVGVPSEAILSRSADFPLKSYEGAVASSDSIVIDAAEEVFDLSRHVLSVRYGFTPPHLRSLESRAPGGPGRLYATGSPGT